MKSAIGKFRKTILCRGCGEMKKIPVISDSQICKECQEAKGHKEAEEHYRKVNGLDVAL